MSLFQRREIVVVLTTAVAVAVIADYWTTLPVYGGTFMEWAVILGAFAMGLAGFSTIRYHIGHALKKTKGLWVFSVWWMIVLAITVLTGLAGLALTFKAEDNPIYIWILNNVYAPLNIAEYGLTGFFTISASYRLLRARTKSSLVFMLVALLVMLGSIAISEAIWSQLPVPGQWISSVPGAAGERGATIAMGIGSVIFALRAMTGRERGYLPE